MQFPLSRGRINTSSVLHNRPDWPGCIGHVFFGDNLNDELSQYILNDEVETLLCYPINEYPEKIKSINFDKVGQYEGKLTGIKGQYIYIDNQFIKKGRIDSIAMQYVGRLGYAEYTTIKSKFKMKRPSWKEFSKK